MKKLVFFLVGFCILIISLVLLLQTNASNTYVISSTEKIKPTLVKKSETLQVYHSIRHGFSFYYHSDWVVHEFSGRDGVDIRPNDARNETITGFITLQVVDKPLNLQAIPFEKYVRVAAIYEMENYKSLLSEIPVTSKDGTIGYTTTWNVLPLAAPQTDQIVKEASSPPITYFPAKDSQKSIEFILSNKEYLSEYNSIIATFQNQ